MGSVPFISSYRTDVVLDILRNAAGIRRKSVRAIGSDIVGSLVHRMNDRCRDIQGCILPGVHHRHWPHVPRG